ncbi:MAG: FecR domain-containing protein [Cycloclasticus sp.]
MNNISTQAAEWLVKLSDESQPPTQAETAAFEQWQQADTRHAKAVQKMQGLIDTLGNLPPQPAAFALDQTAKQQYSENSNWSSLAKMLCLLGALLLPLWLMTPQHQVVGLLADQHTSTGEWKTITLKDNSLIQLSSRSAINVRFSNRQRLIELLHGEILIDVSKDAQRPFIVQTPQGKLTALGTRFSVKQQPNFAVLSVYESKVQASSQQTPAEQTLTAGQRISVYSDHLSNIASFDVASAENALHHHQLVVENQALPAVLEQLEQHYSGHFQYNAAALQHIRVYAVLPLDNPRKALQLLSESTPIKLTEWTPWWVNIK